MSDISGDKWAWMRAELRDGDKVSARVARDLLADLARAEAARVEAQREVNLLAARLANKTDECVRGRVEKGKAERQVREIRAWLRNIYGDGLLGQIDAALSGMSGPTTGGEPDWMSDPTVVWAVDEPPGPTTERANE